MLKSYANLEDFKKCSVKRDLKKNIYKIDLISKLSFDKLDLR